MALPLFIGKIVDQALVVDADPTMLQNTILSLLGISVVGAFASAGRSYFINISGEIVTKSLRDKLFQSVAGKTATFFDKAKSGDLLNRLSADTTLISSSLTESVSMALRGLGSVCIGTGFLFYTSWELACVACGTLLPFVLMTRIYGKYIKKLTKEQLEVFGQATSVAEQAFNTIRTIMLYQKQEVETRRYGDKTLATFEVGKRMTKVRAAFMGASNLSISLSILSIVGFGTNMVGSGAISPGDLTSFIMYSVNVGGSVYSLASVYSSIMRAAGASERVLELIDHEESDMATYDSGTSIPSFEGNISFDNVQFTYPTDRKSVV